MAAHALVKKDAGVRRHFFRLLMATLRTVDLADEVHGQQIAKTSYGGPLAYALLSYISKYHDLTGPKSFSHTYRCLRRWRRYEGVYGIQLFDVQQCGFHQLPENSLAQ